MNTRFSVPVVLRRMAHFTAAVLLTTTSAQTITLASDQADAVREAVQAINNDSYVIRQIAMVSDTASAKTLILRSQEGQLLVQHCDLTIPAIITKITSKERLQSLARIPYFTVFERCKDSRALPVLAAYMDSLAATGDYELLSKANGYTTQMQDMCGGYHYTHTFLYALDALAALGVQTPSPSSCSIFAKRADIVKAARAEFGRRTLPATSH